MTYMASCGSTPCNQYNPMQAEWFLIDRQGQYPNGTWAQASLSAYLKPYVSSDVSDKHYSEWGPGDCDYSFQSRSGQLHRP